MRVCQPLWRGRMDLVQGLEVYTPANAWANAWANACGLACAFWWRVLRTMAGTVACALQQTPWHTPAACGHGVCWRLHGRCLCLHGRCHGRCFVANAMAHATGLWAWRVLALAWRVLALAWQVLCTWQVRWQELVRRSRGHAMREFFEFK